MTMSLVAVFIPVLFLGGLIGRLFHEFAVTIGVAILVSGFVSLTLTPMLCRRFLRPGARTRRRATAGALGRLFQVTEALYQGAVAGYDRGAALGARPRRALMFAGSALILLGTVWLARVVPKGFIPSEDQGQLRATTETTEGTSFDGMERHQVEAMQVVSQDPNVAALHGVHGSGGSGSTANQGRLFMHLVDPDKRALSADDVGRELTGKLEPDSRAARLRAEPAGDQHRRPVVQEPVPVHAAGRRHRPAVPAPRRRWRRAWRRSPD